ncbi:MAG: PAS domain-containing protein [Deltaproteobacteria bacterium]|nr:PAS domain-containing protein [Deltaproteobacteria bacterium]
MSDTTLARRLPWLLVFRAAVTTALLILTLVVDLADWPLGKVAGFLYLTVGASYLVVIVLGVLARARVAAAPLAAAHLTANVIAAIIAVQVTGGVESLFSFLYLLVVLDAAIIAGRGLALALASLCAVTYGTQLVFELYGVLRVTESETPPAGAFASAFIVHVAAFYLIALLAGHLAQLLESARQEVVSARSDLLRIEAFQAAVLESLPVGVMTLAGRMVRSANPAACRIFNLTSDKLVARPLPKELHALLDTDASLHEVVVELDGRRRHLAVGRGPLQLVSRGRETHEIVLVIEDRTEVKGLEKSLREQERLASIGQMAASIAHELRNPLAAISGSVELLSQERAGKAERAQLEAIVLREIARLNRLVTDLLFYARPRPAEYTRVDLVALVRDVCETLRRDVSFDRLRFELSGAPTLQWAADAGQIRQMMWNLLRNAADASPAGGVVEVDLSGPAANGGLASIVVRDHGAGVPAHVRERLFEPFVTTKSTGTGLGLAVVHRIVEAHQGSVALEDAAGGGTAARVLLPQDAGGKTRA